MSTDIHLSVIANTHLMMATRSPAVSSTATLGTDVRRVPPRTSRSQLHAAQQPAMSQVQALRALRAKDKQKQQLFVTLTNPDNDANVVIEAAETLLQRGWLRQARDYAVTMNALQHRAAWQHAVSLLALMTDRSIDADRDIWSDVVHACSRGQQWEVAVSLLQGMLDRNISPNSGAKDFLMTSLAEAGEPKAVARLFNQMRQKASALYERKPSKYTFNAMIRAFFDANLWEEVVLALGDMRNSKLTPDRVAFTQGLTACGRSQQLDKMIRLIEAMSRSQQQPDAIVYGAATSAYAEAQDWAGALKVLRRMMQSSVQPGSMVFSSMMRVCAGNERPDIAQWLLDDQEWFRLTPDARAYWPLALLLLQQVSDCDIIPSAYTYRVVMLSCARNGAEAKVLELLQEMKSKRVPLDAVPYFSVRLPEEADAQHADRVLEFLEKLELHELHPTAPAYNVVMNVCVKAQRWQQALSVLDRMLGAAVNPTAITLTSVINACRGDRPLDMALALSGKLQSYGVERNVIAYNALITACARAGSWDRALRLFQEMRPRGLEPDVISYNAVIDACEGAGRWEWVLWLLEDMKQHDLAPNEVTYSCAISACDKGGQFEWAMHLFSDMRRKGVMPNVIVYNTVLRACMAVKHKDLALSLLDEMKSIKLDPDRITYSAVLGTFEVSSGETADLDVPSEAGAVFREAVEGNVWNDQVRKGERHLDLHRMNVEGARFAVANALKEIRDDPEAQKRDFTFIVGKGKHSEKEAVLGPEIHALLVGTYGMKLPSLRGQGSIRVPARELRRLR